MLRLYGWILRGLPDEPGHPSRAEMLSLARAMRDRSGGGLRFWARLWWDGVSQVAAARVEQVATTMTTT
ncbi:MAG: hypothetical protein RLN75_07140, partial [Longimicrobiales bacterium]